MQECIRKFTLFTAGICRRAPRRYKLFLYMEIMKKSTCQNSVNQRYPTFTPSFRYAGHLVKRNILIIQQLIIRCVGNQKQKKEKKKKKVSLHIMFFAHILIYDGLLKFTSRLNKHLSINKQSIIHTAGMNV
jgi:hypothetical protein